jgi:hypothetical protein
MILKAPKREMKTWGVLNGKIHCIKALFSSRVWVPFESLNQARSDL